MTMRYRCKKVRAGLAVRVVCVLAGLLCTGCGPSVGSMLYWMGVGHGQTVPAQFTLTEGRLAIFLDDPNDLVALPEANAELLRELAKVFRTNEVNDRVVEVEQVARLVHSRTESARWSIRQIGEELGAEQVLYIEVLNFRLRDQPGTPLYRGRWQVAVKVIATERKHDVRLWPKRPPGHRIEIETPLEQDDDPNYPAELSRRMARLLARKIAFLFYDHRLQQEQELTDQ